MARKPNYGFEKRQKEQNRKAKKDAKAAERAARGGGVVFGRVDEFGNPVDADEAEDAATGADDAESQATDEPVADRPE